MTKTLTSELDKYHLFAPRKGRDIIELYPEIKEYEEFRVLSNAEVLLCWYLSCKDSPYYDNAGGDDYVFKISLIKVKEFYPDFKWEQRSKLPQYMKIACDRMSSFEPQLRREAAMGIVKALASLDKVIDLGIDTFKEDASKLKSYVEVMVFSTEKRKMLIKELESFYSLGLKGEEEEEESVANDEVFTSDKFFTKKNDKT